MIYIGFLGSRVEKMEGPSVSKQEKKHCQNKGESKLGEENTTRRVEEEIGMKIKETPNIENVKL
jgi:hypothetical protein